MARTAPTLNTLPVITADDSVRQKTFRLTNQLLILLLGFSWTAMLGQTKTDESGNYSYVSSTEVVMHGVKTDLKLNAKTKQFSVITKVKGDLQNQKEKLEGNYSLLDDKIIFNFKYSQIVINPMFNCKDPADKPCLCSDTLIYKIESISTKDKEIVLKKSK